VNGIINQYKHSVNNLFAWFKVPSQTQYSFWWLNFHKFLSFYRLSRPSLLSTPPKFMTMTHSSADSVTAEIVTVCVSGFHPVAICAWHFIIIIGPIISWILMTPNLMGGTSEQTNKSKQQPTAQEIPVVMYRAVKANRYVVTRLHVF
jgi:hypothetical protein